MGDVVAQILARNYNDEVAVTSEPLHIEQVLPRRQR